MKSVRNSKVAIVIPARLASTRLPRKLLLRVDGKSILQLTYEAASRAAIPSQVLVAADHEEICREVEKFGGQVVMTDPAATCGTDRIAEVAKSLSVEVIVNVQGDEPDISADSIDRAASLLLKDDLLQMTTLATPIRDTRQMSDPSCVKVVFDSMHRALYFSRAGIPFQRDPDSNDSNDVIGYQHLGIYAYRRDFLLRLAAMPSSPLERTEKLEQLRVLEAGIDIKVGVVNESSFGSTRRQILIVF